MGNRNAHLKKTHLRFDLHPEHLILLFTACFSGTPSQSTPAPQPTATQTPKPLPPEEVILTYFNTLNTKDFWKAYEYEWHSKAETKETYNFPCLPVGWGVTYSSIEIISYAKYRETAEISTQYPDKGDIEGQCERFMVSYWADFSSGGDGEFSFMCTLAFDQNTWKIMESGSPTSDSCVRAMKTLEESRQD